MGEGAPTIGTSSVGDIRKGQIVTNKATKRRFTIQGRYKELASKEDGKKAFEKGRVLWILSNLSLGEVLVSDEALRSGSYLIQDPEEGVEEPDTVEYKTRLKIMLPGGARHSEYE